MTQTTTQTTNELMTKRDLAALLQVSARQVENLVRQNRLPQPIRLGQHPRWRRSELMAFISGLTATPDTYANSGSTAGNRSANGACHDMA